MPFCAPPTDRTEGTVPVQNGGSRAWDRLRRSRPVTDLPHNSRQVVLRTRGRCSAPVVTGGVSASRCGDSRQIQILLVRGPGQRKSTRTRRGLRPARLPGTCPAATAAVDEQPVYRIRDSVQGRPHNRQTAERFPLLLGVEEHLEHYAPPVRMPRPVSDPVGQRSLDEGRVMLFLPPKGRNLTVQDLYRPRGHIRDSTSAPANRNTHQPAKPAPCDLGRTPSPTSRTR